MATLLNIQAFFTASTTQASKKCVQSDKVFGAAKSRPKKTSVAVIIEARNAKTTHDDL